MRNVDLDTLDCHSVGLETWQSAVTKIFPSGPHKIPLKEVRYRRERRSSYPTFSIHVPATNGLMILSCLHSSLNFPLINTALSRNVGESSDGRMRGRAAEQLLYRCISNRGYADPSSALAAALIFDSQLRTYAPRYSI